MATCRFHFEKRDFGTDVFSSPRDGKNVSIATLIWGVRGCFGLSFVMASLLTISTMLSTGHLWRADLFELGRHGRIEHDASLVHADAKDGEEYAPIAIHADLVQDLSKDIRPREGSSSELVNVTDMARMRLRRESSSPPLDPIHSEIARGELALMWGIFNTGGCIPLPALLTLLAEERLPDGWRPNHTQGLVDTVMRSQMIKVAMKDLQEHK